MVIGRFWRVTLSVFSHRPLFWTLPVLSSQRRVRAAAANCARRVQHSTAQRSVISRSSTHGLVSSRRRLLRRRRRRRRYGPHVLEHLRCDNFSTRRQFTGPSCDKDLRKTSNCVDALSSLSSSAAAAASAASSSSSSLAAAASAASSSSSSLAAAALDVV